MRAELDREQKIQLIEKFYRTPRDASFEHDYIEALEFILKNCDDLQSVKALEMVLDLILVTINPESENPNDLSSMMSKRIAQLNENDDLDEQDERSFTSYDADDESFNGSFSFPCHANFDDCHPEILINYHNEHLKLLDGVTLRVQLIKYPLICEFMFNFIYDYLEQQQRSDSIRESSQQSDCDKSHGEINPAYKPSNNYLTSLSIFFKKLNKICSNEKRNCRILSTKTQILKIVLKTIRLLIQREPERQFIYLGPILKFAFTLADYKISGSNLRLLFEIIKTKQCDLKLILSEFEKLLLHHTKIKKNLKPIKSLNFPVASKTSEEIESNDYIARSWHWRLRSQVVYIKKNRSRSSSLNKTMSEDQVTSTAIPSQSTADHQANNKTPKPSSIAENDTSCWLECSLIAPLSNISPLISDNGRIKFFCSMWISVCGDLLIIENNNTEHWLKLTQSSKRKRRLFMRTGSNESSRQSLSRQQQVGRQRRASQKIRKRLAHDKEDEEQEEEELANRAKKQSEMELNEKGFLGIRRNISSPLINPSIGSSMKKDKHQQNRRPNSYCSPNNKKSSHKLNPPEDLLHIISFALDTLTIEVWLNVKLMTFRIKACRVAKKDFDEITLQSHLKANGQWSHLAFCLQEANMTTSNGNRLMSFRVVVNGVNEERGKLSYGDHKSPLTNFALLMGCERSTYGYVWKLSQVSIFKNLPPKDVLIYLLGRGPDSSSITNFTSKQQATLPLFDLIQRASSTTTTTTAQSLLLSDIKVLQLYGLINEKLILNWLTQNIVLLYDIGRVDSFLDYSTSKLKASLMSGSSSSSSAATSAAGQVVNNVAEKFIEAKLLNLARSLKFNANESFGLALNEAGGIESTLICFADLIRRTGQTSRAGEPLEVSSNQGDVHYLAFSILLKLASTNHNHMEKFLDDLNGLELIELILIHPNCVINIQMLNQYLDFCLIKRSSLLDRHQISLIKSPKLIYHLLITWRAWHKDIKVAKRLYRKLIGLLQPPSNNNYSRLSTLSNSMDNQEHYFILHNFDMMQRAGSIDILMNILRECLVPQDDVNYSINHDLIDLIVNLIALLIEHPPGMNVLLEIMEFLLFLHSDSKAYVEGSTYDTFGTSYLQALKVSNSSTDDYYNNSSRMSFSDRDPRQASSDEESLVDDDLMSDVDSSFGEQNYFNVNGVVFENAEHEQKEQQRDDDHQYNKVNGQYGNISNRDYAIANLTDMLTSIIKSTSTSDQVKILTEILQRPIIDLKKLIILANNSSEFVREKVLRLFLYCYRASNNLKLLSNNKNNNANEFDLNNSLTSNSNGDRNFKVYLPMQLMARQLLKYPTTIKMIQLCYGLIVEIEDFETVESVCVNFDIETIDNNLQLNNLLLLIQLMVKLQKQEDIIATCKFVHAYFEKLIRNKQSKINQTVIIFLISNLVASLMRLYYYHIRKLKNFELIEIDQNHANSKNQLEYDRLLILIARYYWENLPTSEALFSIEKLLTYLELINTYVPIRYNKILRDRMVLILTTCLTYCKHYEQVSRNKKCGGRIVYNLKSLLKNVDLNSFPNNLSSSQLRKYSIIDLNLNSTATSPSSSSSSSMSKSSSPSPSASSSSSSSSGLDEPLNQNGYTSRVSTDDEDDDTNGNNYSEQINGFHKETSSPSSKRKKISEKEVIERFRTTLEFAINFITTREKDVIPSPTVERQFVFKLIELLANYLHELSDNQRELKCHWAFILPQLEESIKCTFNYLILYLLSPCESMNLEERRYYASELFRIFSVNQLLLLLQDYTEAYKSKTCKILNSFIGDLIQENDEESFTESDTNTSSAAATTIEAGLTIFDDDETKNKLKQMKEIIESNLWPARANQNYPAANNGLASNGYMGNKKFKLLHNNYYSSSYFLNNSNHHNEEDDLKLRDIWLVDLAQKRDAFREKLNELKSSDNQLMLIRNLLMFNSDQSSSPITMLAMSYLDSLDEKLLNEAMLITRNVVNDKHEQRKIYLEDLKQSKIYNYRIKQHWLSLIMGQTHERSIWFMEDFYPKSWELNPVEGPSRVRRRLRPCKLMLEARYFRNDKNNCYGHLYDKKTSSSSSIKQSNSDWHDDLSLMLDDWYNQYSPHPLCSMVINQERSMMDSNDLRSRMFIADKVHFNCDCSIIRPNEVCDGEISIASWCIHFIGERSDNYQKHLFMLNYSRMVNNGNEIMNQPILPPATTTTIVEDLWYDEIVEILDRRYQLQDVGLEIFLTNNMTYFISFRSYKDREDFKSNLMRERHKLINLFKFDLNTSLNKLTSLWRDGKITNFELITAINKIAGRSFNDLMQYPIFPFILSNYSTTILDLNLQANFRNLKRPMAVQNPEKEAIFLQNYLDSQSPTLSLNLPGLPANKPYHYGNHYSNSATVLHFLVRLPPYTQMLIQYQDNNFDQPDRTFHSLLNTWQLITKDSNTDFKELIPEFFYLPEMFLNFESFNLGLKQNNEIVDDVKLPAWCPNSDPRLFTLIHRQALESNYVSENLHHWVDLIFGHKQTGKAAVEALNVFHPATYYGMIDLNSRDYSVAGSNQTSTTNNSSTSTGSSAVALSPIRSAIANVSAKSTIISSQYSSDYMSATLDQQAPSSTVALSDASSRLKRTNQISSHRRNQQADIERLALETMIKTYGQMPRQLFGHPMRQRSYHTFNSTQLGNKSSGNQQSSPTSSDSAAPAAASIRIEPLKEVKGLRWGSFVGSPDENDIIVVDHKKITSDDYASTASRNGFRAKHSMPKPSACFNLCLLPNNDVVIFRQNTSLILDYRADRKSTSQSNLRRYLRKSSSSSSGSSRGFNEGTQSGRLSMSNMIISRQQFCSQAYTDTSYYDPSSSSSTKGQSGSRNKFSLDSLSLVSWSYLDGIIRIRHPALNTQKPSVPLAAADSTIDSMTTCCSLPELNLLLVGYKSGTIGAHIISTTHEAVLPVTQGFDSSTSRLGQQSLGSSSVLDTVFDECPQNISAIDNVAIAAFDSVPIAAFSSSSAAPSAVHFLHTSSCGNSSPSVDLYGPPPPLSFMGRHSSNTGEPYSPLVFAGKTLHSARNSSKTTRWLYSHDKQINCIRISVSFGIIVTGSDDGTTVVWDLNSLSYVRTIDYKLRSSIKQKKPECSKRAAKLQQDETNNFSSSNEEAFESAQNVFSGDTRFKTKRRSSQFIKENIGGHKSAAEQRNLLDYLCDCDSGKLGDQACHICGRGVNLIAISDTLGDIVTVKDINNRLARASDECDENDDGISYSSNDDLHEDQSSSVGGNEDDDMDSLSSVIYAHTINGSFINLVNCNSKVTAVTYSNAPEGISVNVIVVGLSNGKIRLYNSWNLNRVKEFQVSGIDLMISSLLYSRDNQLLYITYEDGQLLVLKNKNKKSSVNLLKEWHLF